MINEQNFFDQPVKNNLRTYDNTRKIMTCKGIDYMTSCLLKTINKCHKMIAKDLNKEQALYADPKAIQQITFTGNLSRQGNANTTMFSII